MNAEHILPQFVLAAVILAMLPDSLLATSSANYGIAANSIDAGGAAAQSANYFNVGSVGGIAGLATVTSPVETMKSGYCGQLYQVTGLSLASTFIDNGTTQQLNATQTLDDGTVLTLTGSQAWSLIAGQLPTGLSLNPATGVIFGTPTKSGTYSFTILVTDGLGNSAQQTFAPSLETFAQWESYFPQLTALSPTATPQNDGVDNLLKYVFDINPTQPMSATDRAALPIMGIDSTDSPGIEYLVLSYRQNPWISGVTVTVQTSFDLKTWTDVIPPNFSQQIGTDPITGDPIVKVGVTMPPGVKQQYIRLNVTQP